MGQVGNRLFLIYVMCLDFLDSSFINQFLDFFVLF